LLAIWRLGAVHVPLFTAFAPAALELRLRGSGAKAVVCDCAQRPKIAAISVGADVELRHVITTGPIDDGATALADLIAKGKPDFAAAITGPDAPLIHIYTSGTTGAPKGVVVPLWMLASVRSYTTFGLDLRPDDIYWCAADPGWAYGLYYGVLGTLATGTPSLLVEGGFSAEATIAVLSRFEVTNFAAAPTVYRALRASGLPVPKLNLRCASSAGEPLNADINEWAMAALGVPIHDHYGQTEAGMLLNNHHHPLLKESLKPGSMGRSLPGWEAAVLCENADAEAPQGEMGRLAMDLSASPLAWFEGYTGGSATRDKFSADGRWYITGDLAREQQDGLFYFSSREDDVILMAGYRIGPSEVEATINAHPGVVESAVVGVRDELRGEVVEAFVVPVGSVADADAFEAEIQHWVKSRYAAHAYPRRVHVTGELPKTPSGKLQRFLLREERNSALAGARKVDSSR
jgi:acetyl-CoA synthetase